MADDKAGLDPSGENPFESPRSAAAPPPAYRRRRRTFLLVVVLGVVLVPIAAAIAGFCCCTAGLLTVSNRWGVDFSFAVLFPGGALAGAAAAIYGLILLRRRLLRSPAEGPTGGAA